MKISSLFSLLTDTTGLLDFFEGVETTEQLVSRLERLKRQATEELLDSIYTTRNSVTEVLDDTIETSATLDGSDDRDLIVDGSGDTLTDGELENLVADTDNAANSTGENQIPPDPTASGKEKT